tara:strand:+ start:442 stop:759 length:318 start_codon:yes stop_codon:yes gene_type:complete
MAIKINYSSGKVGGSTSGINKEFSLLTEKIGKNFSEFPNNDLKNYFQNAIDGDIIQKPVELNVEWEYREDLEKKRNQIIDSIKKSLYKEFPEEDYEVEVSLTDKQ